MNETLRQNELKCYNCGKEFRKPSDFERHKNRKTPCLIREISPEHINNPNRCIFCNKIFSKKENLTKHHKICKIKNGGMDLLVDKVKYDQEIRILKEELAAEKREKNEQVKQLRDDLETLKLAIAAVPRPAVNVTFNAPINVIINNYTNPYLTGIKITPDELANADKISKLLLQKLYFNPELPQNHCIYLQNKKNKSLIIYDEDGWRSISGGNTDDVLLKLSNTITLAGTDVKNGPLCSYITNESFTQLSPADQHKIRNFNLFADILCKDDAYDIFFAGRDTVISTIKAAGCKLI
jgi:hypothetical protein